jgi:DeoR/GlpR family transcriptional regulator of sugar metabolism
VDREAGYRERLLALMPHLNERQQRIAAALEARSSGYGGVSAAAEVSRLARGTIHRDLRELREQRLHSAAVVVRASGGRRKKIAVQSPEVVMR